MSVYTRNIRHAVIFDRDGVLIEDRGYFCEPVVEVLPGVADGLRLLKQAGFLLLVATNQSAIGRGLCTDAIIEQQHQSINAQLHPDARIDTFLYCQHTPEDQCGCRKPAPGMIQALACAYTLTPQNIWVVGDRLRDLQAGKLAGCQLALVRGERTEPEAEALAHIVGGTTYAVADSIVRRVQLGSPFNGAAAYARPS